MAAILDKDAAAKGTLIRLHSGINVLQVHTSANNPVPPRDQRDVGDLARAAVLPRQLPCVLEEPRAFAGGYLDHPVHELRKIRVAGIERPPDLVPTSGRRCRV